MNVIEIKLIFFIFVKVINCNEVITEINVTVLKLVVNYFKIFLIESYINEDDIAFN